MQRNREYEGKEVRPEGYAGTTVGLTPNTSTKAYNQVESLEREVDSLRGKLKSQEEELLNLYRILHGQKY